MAQTRIERISLSRWTTIYGVLGMTTTKDSMLNYTKDEWNKLNYFISVVERLKDYRIKSS